MDDSSTGFVRFRVVTNGRRQTFPDPDQPAAAPGAPPGPGEGVACRYPPPPVGKWRTEMTSAETEFFKVHGGPLLI